MARRETNAFEKLLASIINVVIVFITYLPFHFTNWKGSITFIVLFFLYNIIVLIANRNRCVGMILTKSHWAENYPFYKHFFYTFFYTLSFSTLFIWIYFPFDLFIFNMLLLQLPIVLITKTTLHGYLSGNLITVKN